MTWTLPTSPVCPGCGCYLRPDSIVFQDAVAYCPTCALASSIFLHHHRILLALPGMAKHINIRAGLIFWRPQRPLPMACTVHHAVEVLPAPRIDEPEPKRRPLVIIPPDPQRNALPTSTVAVEV